jgi:hypothetical protein
MWRNMMKSTKSKKASVLHYSIDLLVEPTPKKKKKKKFLMQTFENRYIYIYIFFQNIDKLSST